MVSYVVVASLLVLLPVLVHSAGYKLGGCEFVKADPYADTAEGHLKLKDLMTGSLRVVAWDPFSYEEKFSCLNFTGDMTAGTFTLTYFNGNNVVAPGRMALKTTPTAHVQLTFNAANNQYRVFGSNNDGISRLYPYYLSPTEVVFMACRGHLLGRIESTYMMTDQDLSQLNSTCSAGTVTGAMGYKIIAAPLSCKL